MSNRWSVYRQCLVEQGHTERHIQREILTCEVIAALNDKRDYSGGMFDGEDLGVLHLYFFRSRWEHDWYDLQPLPGKEEGGESGT